MMKLFEKGLAPAARLFKRNATAMPEDEQALFRRCWRRAAHGVPLQDQTAALRTPRSAVVAWWTLIDIVLLTEPENPQQAWQIATDMERQSAQYIGRIRCIPHRAKARLLYEGGQINDALAELRKAIAAIDAPDSDAFNAYPVKRELERLMRDWRKQ